MCRKTNQVQHGNFHHALVEVSGAVFNNLDCDDLLGLEVLTLDDLSKGTLTQDIEDQIAVPETTVS